jgi:hypothetical protein
VKRQESPEIPRLFKSEKGDIAAFASRDGKLTLTYPGWAESKVMKG